MLTKRRSMVVMLAFAAVVWIAGCGSSNKPTATKAASQNGHEHEHEGNGDAAEALAKLSPADRQKAEAQKMCPVSDEPLGSMGVPIKVTAKGQEVFLCCKGCQKDFEADPDKYLAKLKK